MLDVVNPLQSLSYTNKDFVSIYTELLDLTKELASTWDPTISNESDPGVILLKLNAIIGDKLSYNSDTNVLELFPLSVTQERNARQLFEQLGYYMHWYKAATTNVSLTWIGNLDYEKEYTIPAFTVVSDFNNTITYTLIGPVDGTTVNTFKVGDQKLKLDGSTVSFKAIQGIPVLYNISGESTITVRNLDSNNRLYFPSIDVAENGIFITNVGANNYTDWKKVDNLLVQTVSPTNLFYKFGLTQDTSTCYIEFPENAEEIFKNGLNITYIKTLGQEGNVSYKTIEKFYSELSPAEDNTIVLNTDNVRMLNYASAVNGENPQSINKAYKQYKSTIGVFETLVTLRDYIGYILNSGLISNGFVCDRTNDVQCTYNIMTQSNDIDQIVTVVEDDGNNSLLTAFDLKLYLLQLPTSVLETMSAYSSTFDIINGSALDNIESYINDVKCISHDYASLLPTTTSRSHFCYFKNKYPVSCRVTTQYQLTTTAANEVVSKIRKSLYETLNAKEVSFGEEVPFELIYNAIINADGRIKSVILDNIEYTAYAVCYSDILDRFFEVEISSEDEEPVVVTTNPGSSLTVSVDESTFTNRIGIGDYSTYQFRYDSQQDKWRQPNGNPITLSDYGVSITGTPAAGDYINVSISLKTQLRDELYTKSVLAGVTQFLVEDETFDYKLDQTCNDEVNYILRNIDRVTTGLNITMSNSTNDGTYSLRDNESIQLYSPNLIDSTTYSTYVKFEYKLLNGLKADEDYQLGANEYFIMYWKESLSESMYKYAVYGHGNIIKIKSFDLQSNDGENNEGKMLASYMTNIGTEENPVLFTSSDVNNRMTYPISEAISTLSGNNNTLSTTKTITIRKVNQIVLAAGDSYCYWILNDTVVDSNGVEKYRLFESGDSSVILNSGEYFIYTDSTLTNMTILGSGTLISRSDDDYIWEVDVKNASDIIRDGINSFKEDDWFRIIPSNSTVTLTEQYYFNIGEGSKFRLHLSRNRGQYCDASISASSGLTATLNKDTWFTHTDGYGDYVFTYNGTSWRSGERDVNLADYGITITDGTPASGNVITVNTTAWQLRIDGDGTYKVVNGQEFPTSLKDFDISYKAANEDAYVNVSALNLESSDYSWMARSLLSLNASNIEEQKLLGNQYLILNLHNRYYSLDPLSGSSITTYRFVVNDITYEFTTSSSYDITSVLFDAEEEKLYINKQEYPYSVVETSSATLVELSNSYTLTGSNFDSTNSCYPVVFMTNYNLSMDGGQTLSTHMVTEELEVAYLDIYTYQKYISNSTQIHISDDGEFDIEFLSGISGVQTITIPFKLPVGEYIMPIYIGSNELETLGVSLRIRLNGDLQHTINSPSETNFYKKQKYSIYLNITNESNQLQLQLTDTTTKNVPIILYNLFKYNYNNSIMKLEDAEFQSSKILGLLRIWDRNNLFNYTYKINKDDEISNPLEGKSFFLSNHIYNKFTIPQMASNLDINIIGKK